MVSPRERLAEWTSRQGQGGRARSRTGTAGGKDQTPEALETKACGPCSVSAGRVWRKAFRGALVGASERDAAAFASSFRCCLLALVHADLSYDDDDLSRRTTGLPVCGVHGLKASILPRDVVRREFVDIAAMGARLC